VIENGAEVGGLCILRGCMPTKILLHAAEVLHHVKHCGRFGISADNTGFDFAKVMERKDRFIEELAEDRRNQLGDGQFEFIRGHASFLDPLTVAVSNHGPLTDWHFIITAGSTVAPPHLPQLRETGYLTSDDALKLSELPKSLIILGGGAVAVEFAQFFARFGVHVTLLQRSEHILRDFDTDAAMEIEKVFGREGIDVFTNTELTDARHNGKL
jgi:pyruvate/2-oxoglutarate dehydrogenase complex dihydrolipoamide dehydrogenase (E3) component